MPSASERYIVKPGDSVKLSDLDAADTRGWTKKKARAKTAELQVRLNELQVQLYANRSHALLVVLQGMDTSGKDGVIKHVMGAFNPQGCQVTSFKVPTSEELAHDFLWRIHKAVPARGTVGIFNRSHYEDVLVVRVEDLVPKRVWHERYDAIREFEEALAESGVVMLKFFLHISKEEQRTRLVDRLADPHDHWKFRAADLDARAKWDQYTAAYEDALTQCSTSYAPWYVIPADKKWYRNLVISKITIDALERLDMGWPPLEEDAVGIEIE